MNKKLNITMESETEWDNDKEELVTTKTYDLHIPWKNPLLNFIGLGALLLLFVGGLVFSIYEKIWFTGILCFIGSIFLFIGIIVSTFNQEETYTFKTRKGAENYAKYLEE